LRTSAKRWALRAPIIVTVGVALLPTGAIAQGFFDFFRPHYYPRNNDYSSPRSYPESSEVDRPRSHDSTRERGAVHREAQKQPAPKGPLTIVVSIARQRVTVFDRETEIAHAPVSTGVPGHPTPLGVFTVIQKQYYHESNLYSAAPMPFMQRITWSGVALHAGMLPGYPASHGCIRLPREFAVRLYAMTKTGARVIVARNEPAPVAITHAALFQPQPPEEPKPAPMASLPVEMVASVKPSDGSQSDITSSVTVPQAPEPPKPAPEAAPKHKGKVSVFISRKQGKLYVRQGFDPLFEMPITIADPDKPIGTHVFTATGLSDDGKTMQWSALSIPSSSPRNAAPPERTSHHRRHDAKDAPRLEPPPMPSAAAALDRIDIPQDARSRIDQLLTPGASLIVSDNALSDETGSDTDFVVLTP